MELCRCCRVTHLGCRHLELKTWKDILPEEGFARLGILADIDTEDRKTRADCDRRRDSASHQHQGIVRREQLSNLMRTFQLRFVRQPDPLTPDVRPLLYSIEMDSVTDFVEYLIGKPFFPPQAAFGQLLSRDLAEGG